MAIDENERDALRLKTIEKLNREKFDKLRELDFENIKDISDEDISNRTVAKIVQRATITANDLPKALTSSLKSAGMFREDIFEDAVKFTFNDTLDAGEELAARQAERDRLFVRIKYKGKVTGSRKINPQLIQKITGSVDTENYDTIDERHKSIFTDMLASASVDLKVKRIDFEKTNAAGGEVHKVIIKNKNPIQAPLILNISSSGV